MKVLSTSQMYDADQATMNNLAISSIDLMEKAAGKCSDWILNRYKNFGGVFHVVCGVGNNGGDGLVISRILLQNEQKVKTYIIPFSKNESSDFKVNLIRIRELGHDPEYLTDENRHISCSSDDLVVDAIFGLGLSRPPAGLSKSIIQSINRSGATIVSIDFPSGLFSEDSVQDEESVIRANHCLTFQNPKLAFLLPENQEFIENWSILDIGLDKGFITGLPSQYTLIDQGFIRNVFQRRAKFSHKGSFGHSLLIGGSFGKIGAMVLASRAALCAGSGLVSSYIPKCGYTVLQTANPEVMVEVDDENYIQFFNYKTIPDAVGIGPGLGMHLKTKKGFIKYISSLNIPLVLDADALNILSEHEELLTLIPENSILTPHPKEFERLAGSWNDDFDKLKKQQNFAKSYRCTVVLKGAHTSITQGDVIYFNNSGNPALATAGSGDVLTGIITGLLAQGYASFEAAILGVYLHGRAADHAIKSKSSEESFTAMDGIHFLGTSFKEIY